MEHWHKWVVCLAAASMLSACMPEADMQGHDPREFYRDHPIRNTIETKTGRLLVQFQPGASRLSPAEIDRLSDGLHPYSMASIEKIEMGFAGGDGMKESRKKSLQRLLRNLGYVRGSYDVAADSALGVNQVRLTLTYAVVVSPDCPDWRRSPVTTHSNTEQGNFGCATEFDLGRMVADPHDLVRGTEGEIPVDTVSAARAVQQYREGGSGSSVGGTSMTGSNSSEGGDNGASASGFSNTQ
jgi:pilus biogenesis lipoprotein CpaD